MIFLSYLLYYRLGLEKIYQLTRTGTHTLRVRLGDWDGNTADAEYSQFRLEDENDRYRLRFDSFITGRSTAGDSLDVDNAHRNQQFCTAERSSLARDLESGWWFNSNGIGDVDSNLNGVYSMSADVAKNKGIIWETWKPRGNYYSLKLTHMMIRHHT